MCFFKRKKKVVITYNKYNVGQAVLFKYHGEMSPGAIIHVKLDENNNVIYDVQIGGECPAIINNVKEEDIHLRKAVN